MDNLKIIGYETKLKENKEKHDKRMENIFQEMNQKLSLIIQKHQITSIEYTCLLANLIQNENLHRINESLARTTNLEMSGSIGNKIKN